MHLILKYPDKLNWYHFSSNANAINTLISHMDYVHPTGILKNPHVFYILDKLPDFPYGWSILSQNPGVIDMLEQNKHKVDWFSILENPAIFYPTKNKKLIDVLYECRI